MSRIRMFKRAREDGMEIMEGRSKGIVSETKTAKEERRDER